MRADPFPPVPARGSALLITLALLSLVTIFVTALVSIMVDEGNSAHSHRNRQGALVVAGEGFDRALASLRAALDPADAWTNDASAGFWSSAPGAVVRFRPDGSTNQVFYLYSGANAKGTITNAAPDQVDLNLRGYDGNHSLGGSAIAAAMKVGWVTTLKNESLPPSKENPVAARYAYWIDDESSRVNVNTADGTQRAVVGAYGPGSGANSFGPGYPTDVNLAALGGSFSGKAPQIVSNAWLQGFDSERAVLDAGVASADYQSNRFNLTAFGRSPEVNLFGDPKIYLMTALNGSGTGALTNAMIGLQSGTGATTPVGLPLAQIYPTSLQATNFIPAAALTGLPAGFFFPQAGYSATNRVRSATLPQFCTWAPYTIGAWNNSTWQTYAMVARVAQYLKGYNSRGQAVAWPSYPGYPGTGFAGKYTDRQLDSIALQIVQQASANAFADANAIHASGDAYMVKGPLSGQLVSGSGRMPRLTQVLVAVSAVSTNVSVPVVTAGPHVAYTNAPVLGLAFTLYAEWFFPPQARGASSTFSSVNIPGLPPPNWSGNNRFETFNCYDSPPLGTYTQNGFTNFTYPTGPSYLSTNAGVLVPNDFWMSNLLRVTDAADGSEAGVDMYGLSSSYYEPTNSAHQARVARDHPWCLDVTGLTNSMKLGSPVTNYFGSMPASSGSRSALSITGSGTITNTPGDYYLIASGGSAPGYRLTRPNVSSVNIDGGLSLWSGPGNTWNLFSAVPLDSLHGPVLGETMASQLNSITNALLPVHIKGLAAGQTRYVHLWVDDPYVNQFPGDWHSDGDNSLASRNTHPGTVITYRAPSYPGYTNNSTYAWARTNDWEALAMPVLDTSLPKSQRIPGVGVLQNIRTGLMPDIDTTNLPVDQQHGTPWRTLDLGTNQVTAGGVRYPDWAMLDLFTVPATLQASAQSGAPPPVRELTWGGSTAGRVNPNGSVVAPWGIGRSVPLSAVLLGMNYADNRGVTNSLSASAVQKLVAGITNYIAANGPFRTAAEVANVPAVAAYTQDSGRNDVAKQLAGLLTTRSSVFSVWVVGQSVQKSVKNTQYGQVEPGDSITGESRVRYVVERYLDPGADGLIGNSRSAGADGLVGTWDDAVTSAAPNYHPYNPTYRYRIIYAEPVAP